MKRLVIALAIIMTTRDLVAGLTYHIEQVTEAVRARRMVAVAKTDGGKSRLDIVKSDTMLFDAGTIVLSSANARTLTVINPAKKTYYVLNLDDVQKSAGGFVTMSKPVVSVRNAGNGGVVQGYPTQRWLVTSREDVTVNMIGQKSTQRIELSSEIWTTDKLATATTSIFGADPSDPLLGALGAAQSQIKGFPLKSNTTAKVSIGGSTTTTKIKLTITNVQQTTIPPSTFLLPAGFTKIDSPLEALAGAISH